MIVLTFVVAWSAALAPLVNAEVRLPRVFGSHMVLQRDMPVVVWGWAQPNETVTVSMASSTVQAQANERGEWKAVLPPMKAGGPFTLKIAGSSTVEFDDVLIGEVWLCSGQSNMEMGVGMVRDAHMEIAEADHPHIRLLMVQHKWLGAPTNDIDGEWRVCTPMSVAAGGWSGFSATAYFFGRELHQKLNVPVGLIDSSWGGTRIESWTAPEGFAATPALSKDYETLRMADPANPQHEARMQQALDQQDQWLAKARQALSNRSAIPLMPAFPSELLPPHDLQNATALYNGMIHPLCPFVLRGAIWYQGEANLGEGMRYMERMKALVNGWRAIWREGDFPFYFVQIAPFTYPGRADAEAELWEAQAEAARVIENTGMAVVNDIGNLKDIHPKDKQDVGHRLALLALARTYGNHDLVCSGPTFKSLSIEGGKLRVIFENVGSGLVSRDGKPLSWFEIMDAAGSAFVKADARIDGPSVVLSAPGVKHPVAMRFAWSMLAEPNLMNKEGLPTGAFRAGTVPKKN